MAGKKEHIAADLRDFGDLLKNRIRVVRVLGSHDQWLTCNLCMHVLIHKSCVLRFADELIHSKLYMYVQYQHFWCLFFFFIFFVSY